MTSRILFTSLCFILSLSCISAQHVAFGNQNPGNTTINIEIANGQMCAPNTAGFCFIGLIQPNNPGANNNNMRGTIQVDAHGRILITFDMQSITREAYHLNFVNGYFIMPHNFPIPLEVKQAIGYNGNNLVLAAGNYPAFEMNGAITTGINTLAY